MKLIDNVNNRLGDDLKESIKKGSKLSIAASSFSIYAYESLKKELESIDELRFIFTSPTFVEEKFKKEVPKFFIPHLFKEADLCGGDFELRLKNNLNQRSIAKECSKWVQSKVKFKTNSNFSTPLNSIMHINSLDNSNDAAYLNVNNFNTSDLGLTESNGFPTLIQKSVYPESLAYLNWFDQVWQNEDNLRDVTTKVQEYFQNAFTENSPELIYFITLYNIFNDFL